MVGYIINNNLKTSHIAQIFGVYVIHEYRGQGVGNKLIEVAVKLIQENRHTSKIKVTVNPEKKAAVKLYDKYGFEIVGRLKNELKVNGKFYDGLIMEKYL